jgi:hypothetical protein
MHEPDKPLLPGVDRLDWQANDVFRSSSLLVKFSTESPTRRAREPDDKGIFDMNVTTITYESFQPNLTKILCRDVKTIIIPLSNGYLMKVGVNRHNLTKDSASPTATSVLLGLFSRVAITAYGVPVTPSDCTVCSNGYAQHSTIRTSPTELHPR